MASSRRGSRHYCTLLGNGVERGNHEDSNAREWFPILASNGSTNHHAPHPATLLRPTIFAPLDSCTSSIGTFFGVMGIRVAGHIAAPLLP
jgi:hypothetical protein